MHAVALARPYSQPAYPKAHPLPSKIELNKLQIYTENNRQTEVHGRFMHAYRRQKVRRILSTCFNVCRYPVVPPLTCPDQNSWPWQHIRYAHSVLSRSRHAQWLRPETTRVELSNDTKLARTLCGFMAKLKRLSEDPSLVVF